MNCLILGSKSEIAMSLGLALEKDGHTIRGWSRGQKLRPEGGWDLCLITLGTAKPVGLFHEAHIEHWKESIYSNLTLPFELLRKVWPEHNPGARVCFFAGLNTKSGYSAYNVSKTALLKLCEQLDLEAPDAVFFALDPDSVGIYKALMWCVGQPKEVVGGRSVCVSDVIPYMDALTAALKGDDELFKLNRKKFKPFGGLG